MEQMGPRVDQEQARDRKKYRAPKIVHEVEMETRAGSPLFVSDPTTGQLQNPWDPDFTQYER